MKKLALLLGLVLTTTFSYSQCSTYRPQKYHSTERSNFQLSINYGTLPSLGGEIVYQLNNNIFGFGYAGYVGSKHTNLSLDGNQYHIKNETLYLTYGRKINSFVVGIKVGKQNDADWNKKVFSTGSYTFEKDANEYTTMVGIYGGFYLSEAFRVNIGIDSFSTATLGFSVAL